MVSVLIVYYTKSGNTREMANMLAGALRGEKIDVEVRDALETSPDYLLDYDGIILGSPTYYGGMAAEMKDLIDRSVKYHGELSGKLGGAFTSSAYIGGGNETTLLSILKAMLIHGMVVVGVHNADHFGPVSIGAPDERAEKQCRIYARKFADTLKILKGFDIVD
ncbi:MAG: NAD(P)H dehydrogenase (quinone) [Candidatus Methanofastidiosum methylothiophilum]|uniref:NAD(P)H dehydrogenase (Quinone) n=1 Tax=Candidatus Methanofastidiosum methylothiophilum TaxID=1705564 RepID=A0A150IZB9_9EURY|nr:MAG: NAD(P)H dehydrogenase (quinone) [Candidatus Methanofastidiosum methylthiophilus]KYC47247.1 MAG: NAD(P)H dehydrogenase (quinone) [Candidatus Methanofastidiosum methylthiophilus]KYC50341.1 MAG: NAD(P)H dehydrogenase (quinone) [Candidatus Methanofastidiosum methylthiophilus]